MATQTSLVAGQIRLRQWAEQIRDYLGHVKPTDTFWYLSAIPELLKVSCSKYEEQFGGNDDEI